MIIEERMSTPITVGPNDLVDDAYRMMKEKKIHRVVVVEKGSVVGLLSDRDVLRAAPSGASTLSAFEAAYLISKLKVKQIMKKKIVSITKDTTFEEAARVMAEEDVSCLPVLEAGKLVGVISRTDILNMTIELFGAKRFGVRISFLVDDRPGILAKVLAILSEKGWNVISLGTFEGSEPGRKICTIKLEAENKSEVIDAVKPLAVKILDVREV